MIRIVIADDHPLVIEGIKKVVSRNGQDIEIVGEAGTARELMKLLEREQPDMVILDFAMPDKSGLDILKDISSRYDKLPVLMLSMHPEERFAVRSLKHGAYGYLNKESVPDELINAIRKVSSRKKYISERVAEQLAAEVNGRHTEDPHQKLSDREMQVLMMIASGMKIKEIAESLSLSSRTIHTYRLRLMEKLDLGSNVAIARYALSRKLIDEP